MGGRVIFDSIEKTERDFWSLQDKVDWKYAMITFTQDSFDKEYSVDSRTYMFGSDEKLFNPKMLGVSLFATNLDASDISVNLWRYMMNGKDSWHIEKCYVLNIETAEEAEAIWKRGEQAYKAS